MARALSLLRLYRCRKVRLSVHLFSLGGHERDKKFSREQKRDRK